MLLPEKNIPYKTYVKAALVLALQDKFENDRDLALRRTKVSVDYPNSQAKYPALIVRFFEREIHNAGVGHIEWLAADAEDELDVTAFPYKHYLYEGDIEFAILALSSKDRDLISDSLITTLALSDPALKTDFFTQIYSPDFDLNPDDNIDPWRYNFVNLNTDKIGGFGETQNPAPWLSEDQLQYQSTYRVGIFGEFYSLPPEAEPTGPVDRVTIIPYMEGYESMPNGVVIDDPVRSTVEYPHAYRVGPKPLPTITATENDPGVWS